MFLFWVDCAGVDTNIVLRHSYVKKIGGKCIFIWDVRDVGAAIHPSNTVGRPQAANLFDHSNVCNTIFNGCSLFVGLDSTYGAFWPVRWIGLL